MGRAVTSYRRYRQRNSGIDIHRPLQYCIDFKSLPLLSNLTCKASSFMIYCLVLLNYVHTVEIGGEGGAI